MTQEISTDFNLHETEFKITAFEEALGSFWEPFIDFFDNCNEDIFTTMVGVG